MSDETNDDAPAAGAPRKLTLARAITVTTKSGAEQVSEVEFKDPPGQLALDRGLPYTTVAESENERERYETRVNLAVMRAYMARMTGLREEELADMTARDIARAQTIVIAMTTPAGLPGGAKDGAPAPGASRTLPLEKPITVHGKAGVEQRSEIEFKEPSGKLVLYRDLPFSTVGETDGEHQRFETRVNPIVMRAYLVEMTGLDEGELAGMTVRDVARAHNLVIGMTSPFVL